MGVLFAVSVLLAALLLFHLYFQCWLFRRGRRLQERHDTEDTSSSGHHHHRSTAASEITSRGLDPSAIMLLPTFLYDAKDQEPRLECAVCISEFQHNEAGRVLPECSHRFHVDCIDMWLQSHCDCPLCRARVKGQPAVNRVETGENPFDGAVPSAGPGVVLGPAQSEGLPMGLASSARTLDAGPMEQHLTKTEDDSDPDPDHDGGFGPDLELGSNYGTLHVSNGVH